MKYFGKHILSLIIAITVTEHCMAEGMPGKQVELEFSVKGDETLSTRYLLFLPANYEQGTNTWPMIFFLHGRGESHGPLSLVKKWGPPRLVETKPDTPYVVVSPQCPPEENWSVDRQQRILTKLLDHVIASQRIDQDRIYLTGLSMGGFGSWTWAAAQPERFAAVIPICGGGKPEDAANLKWLPIWVFHGDQDGAVPIGRSIEMVEAVRKAGSKAIRFTTLEHFGHNSWSATYANPGLYQWLNAQTASANRKRSETK